MTSNWQTGFTVCDRCWSYPCRCQAPVYVMPPCDHCYCKDAAYTSGEGPHKQCCKCGTTMSVAQIEYRTALEYMRAKRGEP